MHCAHCIFVLLAIIKRRHWRHELQGEEILAQTMNIFFENQKIASKQFMIDFDLWTADASAS